MYNFIKKITIYEIIISLSLRKKLKVTKNILYYLSGGVGLKVWSVLLWMFEVRLSFVSILLQTLIINY